MRLSERTAIVDQCRSIVCKRVIVLGGILKPIYFRLGSRFLTLLAASRRVFAIYKFPADSNIDPKIKQYSILPLFPFSLASAVVLQFNSHTLARTQNLKQSPV